MAKEVVGVKCRCAGGSSANNMSGARIGWAVTGRIRSREERAGEGSAQAGKRRQRSENGVVRGRAGDEVRIGTE